MQPHSHIGLDFYMLVRGVATTVSAVCIMTGIALFGYGRSRQ